MSKKADRPDWEYGLGLRECKARSNPWAFIDGSLKAETWGLLADWQGCAVETLNRMSKKADRPDWEYGLGLRECKARSNPWAFIDGSLKAETWGLLADRQGCVLETLNRMSKKVDRGEWNE